MRPPIALLAAIFILGTAASRAEEPAPLVLEAKIPLGDVYGRIDHMAFDPGRQRLFVAELGNDSVGVVDVKQRAVVKRLTRLREPQGVGYEPKSDTLYAASGVDGTVSLFEGAALAPGPVIALGKDADNVRVDAKNGTVVVGYGSGGLAVIDPVQRTKTAEILLRDHPEGFQLDPAGVRIFVNIPDAREIAVIDRRSGKQTASWPMRDARANFPMALDPDGMRVIAVFRRPAKLIAFSAKDGATVASIDTCADADDVFVDERRHRLYVSCGEGVVDVIERRGKDYARIARVPTVSGARTAFFAAELDRLFVGVRAITGPSAEPAALWVFRPAP